MAEAIEIGLEEQAFRSDIAKGSYLVGELAGRWKVHGIEWPTVIATVTAADGRQFCFRFTCVDYPVSPVTARVWDRVSDQPPPFEDWPKGGPRVLAVFRNDWKGGRALYLPTDAVAIKGHPNWVHQYPSMIWRRDRGIVHYLEILHELLN